MIHAPDLAGLIIEILNTEAELSENDNKFIHDMIKPIFDKLEAQIYLQKKNMATLQVDLNG